MTYSVCDATDIGLMQFLTIIRKQNPTELEITSTLQDCIVGVEDIHQHLDINTTILCTHRSDVQYYNILVLQRSFNSTEIQEVHVKTNAEEESALNSWINDSKFHELHAIAIGARCMITGNIDLSVGEANSAICTIIEMEKSTDENVTSIVVSIIATNKFVTLRRLKHKQTSINGTWYHKSTFPLSLAYAMTGHKSQGATIHNKLLLVFKDAFALGLAYVMLSRITDRKNLKILGMPTPDIFSPMPSTIVH
ncbi:hypothetical protein L7F22_016406 [Adiantum nelumboides]|nr:hypothetical protein [Adiantum nelumboides]